MTYLGYLAFLLTIYNIICGMLFRINGKTEASLSAGIEASLWFISGCICFK